MREMGQTGEDAEFVGEEDGCGWGERCRERGTDTSTELNDGWRRCSASVAAAAAAAAAHCGKRLRKQSKVQERNKHSKRKRERTQKEQR